MESLEKDYRERFPMGDMLVSPTEWLETCRTVFEQRYAVFPDKIKIPSEKMDPSAWDWLPKPGSVGVVTTKELEEIRGIYIQENAREISTQGWVFSISPSFLESVELEMFFPHPLDYVGRAFTWSRYVGVTMKMDPYARNFEGKFYQLHHQDLLGHLTQLRVPE